MADACQSTIMRRPIYFRTQDLWLPHRNGACGGRSNLAGRRNRPPHFDAAIQVYGPFAVLVIAKRFDPRKYSDDWNDCRPNTLPAGQALMGTTETPGSNAGPQGRAITSCVSARWMGVTNRILCLVRPKDHAVCCDRRGAGLDRVSSL
jgi:hypothetical protein